MPNRLFLILALFVFVPVLTLCGQRSPEARDLLARGNNAESSDPQGAMEYYRSAVSTDPAWADPRLALAMLFQKLGNTDSAIAWYERVLAVAPRHLEAAQSLAAAYHMESRYDDAISAYRTLLTYYADYPYAYYGMGLVYYSQQDYDRAITNGETALRIFLAGDRADLASDARMLAGQGYMQQGNYERAIQYFKASRKHYEGKPFYHYYLGYSYLMMGNKEKGVEALLLSEQMGYKIPAYIKNRMQ
ncbi:MAG: hypothetical protein EAZ89_06400 [Bacteroidetes bacterium]|nr:MAG: hypothetical protein EAZ89_06400 [Bacteroidota bacterium]